MYIGTINSISQMRFLRGSISLVTPFRAGLYTNKQHFGYFFCLFAESIIKKYEILDSYGFDEAVLLFLHNLCKEAEDREELKTRVEQTLRLLVLWNGRNEGNNQIACKQNVYLSTLKNEIEFNLLFIREQSFHLYNQLNNLYSSAGTRQNLSQCQYLISELNTSVNSAAGTGKIFREQLFRDNQVQIVTNIAADTKNVPAGKTIKPCSLSNSFLIMLENVASISHTANNSEIFYTSVNKQLLNNLLSQNLTGANSVQNLFSRNDTDYGELLFSEGERQISNLLSNVNHHELSVILSNIRRETTSNVSDIHNSPDAFSTVNNIGHKNIFETENINKISRSANFMQYIPEKGEQAFNVISPKKIAELSNIREYTTLQELTMRLFSQERGPDISQLITSRELFFRGILPLLKIKSFTKKELLRILENGKREEKILTVSALSFATDRIEKIHKYDNRFESISLLKSFLHSVESNNYDFSKTCKLGGAELTLHQVLSRQEQPVWNELENQVNRFKTAVSEQINNIGILEVLLSRSLTKNEVKTVLNDTNKENLIKVQKFNMRTTDNAQTIANLQSLSRFQYFLNIPGLQQPKHNRQAIIRSRKYIIPNEETSENTWLNVSLVSSKNNKVMRLLSQLSRFISHNNSFRPISNLWPISNPWPIPTVHEEHYLAGEQKIIVNSTPAGDLTGGQILFNIKPAGKVTGGGQKTTSFVRPETSKISHGPGPAKIDSIKYMLNHITFTDSGRDSNIPGSYISHNNWLGLILNPRQTISVHEEHYHPAGDQKKFSTPAPEGDIPVGQILFKNLTKNIQSLAFFTASGKDSKISGSYISRNNRLGPISNLPQTISVYEKQYYPDREQKKFLNPTLAGDLTGGQILFTKLTKNIHNLTSFTPPGKYSNIRGSQTGFAGPGPIINLWQIAPVHSKYLNTIGQGIQTNKNVRQNISSYAGDTEESINLKSEALIDATKRKDSEKDKPVIAGQTVLVRDIKTDEQVQEKAELIYSKIEKETPERGSQTSLVRDVSILEQSNIPIIKNSTNISVTRVKKPDAGKFLSLMNKRELKGRREQDLPGYIRGNFLTIQGDFIAGNNNLVYDNSGIVNNRQESTYFDNNTDIQTAMVLHSTTGSKKKEPQKTVSQTLSQSELISRFGNLIADPNILPPELTNRQTGSILTGSALSDSAGFSRRMSEKFKPEEKTYNEEQSRVTELTQKLTEQEAVIYKLQHACSQLQEDMAASTNIKKITAAVMKEFKDKLKLEKMRYGLQ